MKTNSRIISLQVWEPASVDKGVDTELQVGPGSGLSLSKCFGPAYKILINDIQSNDFFFP